MAYRLPKSSHPVHTNEGFICMNCGTQNPPAEKSCRNHCNKCLFSLHVDLEIPGDRLSDCHGLMEPVAIVKKGKKEQQIVHKCLKCGKKQVNITAPDDDTDAIIKVMQKQNLDYE